MWNRTATVRRQALHRTPNDVGPNVCWRDRFAFLFLEASQRAKGKQPARKFPKGSRDLPRPSETFRDILGWGGTPERGPRMSGGRATSRAPLETPPPPLIVPPRRPPKDPY
jgi:hypothetical protein